MATAAVGLFALPALAQDFSQAEAAARAVGISEMRAGVMVDDVELFDAAPHIIPRLDTINAGNLSTLSFDVLFRSPDIEAFRWIGSPRPTIGVDLDFRHESMLHLSLNWHVPLGSSRFFLEPELGVAIHDGALSGATAPYRNLGCRGLFFWSLAAGYDIDEHWDAMISLQHASQADLCGPTTNQGLNYAGIRIGYKF